MRGNNFAASIRPGVQGQGPGKHEVDSIDRCVDPILSSDTTAEYTKTIIIRRTN